MDNLSWVNGRTMNETICVSRMGERRGAHSLKDGLKDREGRKEEGNNVPVACGRTN